MGKSSAISALLLRQEYTSRDLRSHWDPCVSVPVARRQAFRTGNVNMVASMPPC